jgi:hypothetical protein
VNTNGHDGVDLGECAFTYLRCRSGHERDSMRVFGPIVPDSPAFGKSCIICNDQMLTGERPTLVPLGPGREQTPTRAGGWYRCLAVVVHAECAGLKP